MRLISVEIANYRVLRQATIALPDTLIGIIGPNGSGKSSVVEAISWALYGQQAARSARSEVKSTFATPAETCEVRLTFEVRGERHQVIRRLVGAGQRLEVELYRGGAVEVVGSTETQAYIERLLGLDWRGYITSVFARQSDLDAFSGLQPARRREHLVAMLGIDRLDRAIDRAKAEVRLDAERVVLLEKQAAPVSELEAGLAGLHERLKKTDEAIRLAGGARDEAARLLGEVAGQHAEHERRKDACSQLESRLEIEQAALGQLAERTEQLLAEKKGLEQLRLQVEGSRSLLKELGPIRAEIRQLEKARESATARTAVLSELESLQGQWTASDEVVRSVAIRLGDIQSSLTTTPTVSPQELQAARSDLERAREQYLMFSEQKKQAEREAQKIRDNLRQIASLGGEAVCSRCLRPYGDDLEQVRRHLEEELSGTETVVCGIEERLRESARSGAALKETVRNLETTLEKNRTLRQTMELTESERKQAESQRAMLAERIDLLKRQLAGIGEVSFDQSKWDGLSARLAELEALDRKLTEADGQLRRWPAIEESLEKVSQDVAAATGRIEELRTQLTAVAFDRQSFSESGAELRNATSAAQVARDKYVEAVHEKELLAREATSAGQRLAALQELESDLKAVRNRRSRTDRLARLFGDLRRNLVAGIRPRLAEIGSELLSDMTAGRYTSMELDEDYNISIYDNGQAFGIERFSGGESDLANLCLRLAVSLSLAESAGLERSLVILDEVFGSQDENRRELIYQGLAGLKSRFPQIIAITHIEELKNRVETLIEIVPTGSGWSEVRVDGILA